MKPDYDEEPPHELAASSVQMSEEEFLSSIEARPDPTEAVNERASLLRPAREAGFRIFAPKRRLSVDLEF